MQLLPQSVQASVIAYLDPATKRAARLASMEVQRLADMSITRLGITLSGGTVGSSSHSPRGLLGLAAAAQLLSSGQLCRLEELHIESDNSGVRGN